MKVAKKGESSFSEFIAEIETRLISYLRYSCGSSTDAEDLFQEVCVKLHHEWHEVSRMEKPHSWVFRVAHNMVVNRFRRKDVERRGLKLLSSSEARAGDAHEDLALSEMSKAVEAALSSLPEDQRFAVCQKIWGDCSWVEIGKTLGVSDDTAARLFSRGVQAIAPMLKGFSG